MDLRVASVSVLSIRAISPVSFYDSLRTPGASRTPSANSVANPSLRAASAFFLPRRA
jgi:hypothetical protein